MGESPRDVWAGRLGAALATSYLDSERDVDDFLDRLREVFVDTIADGKRVCIW